MLPGLRRAWMPISVAMLAATALILVGALSAGSATSTCERCHDAGRYSGGVAGAHRSASCADCHANGTLARAGLALEVATRMLPARVGGRTLPANPVSSETCIGCHGSAPAVGPRNSGLRINHATCAAPVRTPCTGCHTLSAHSASAVRWVQQPMMEECIACHRKQNAPSACDTCHVGRIPTERLLNGPWQVTHGAMWKTTHGAGDVKYCPTCHQPTKCKKCHGVEMPHPDGFGQTHGNEAIRNRAACRQCHSEALCNGCHEGIAMPHPAGFLRRHSAAAKSVDDSRCLPCHKADDCERCHTEHVHPGITDGTIKLPVAPQSVGK